jgi:hypothetical protein
MKEVDYGGWTSYAYMKQNKEAFSNCIKWGGERTEGRDGGGV